MQRSRFFSRLVLIAIFVGCSEIRAQQSIDGVVGKNDLLLVERTMFNVPVAYRKLLPAIGHLSSNCTVAHIGQGIVLTSGHCFWQTYYDGNLYKQGKCTDEVVRWGWTIGNDSPQISKCVEIIAMQKDPLLGLDFAIMKVDNPPAAKIAVDWTYTPKALATMTIFSYPNDKRLTWSKYCPIKKTTSKDVFPLQLHHTCDTEIGSSGAPVLNAMTGAVIALHRSGDQEVLDDETLSPAIENYAVYVSRTPIRALLKEAGYNF